MTLSAMDQLVQALGKLPGVGQRTAKRYALHLLKQKESRMPMLMKSLERAYQTIVHCGVCGALDDCDPCRICSDSRRDPTIICVVEDMGDIWAIERSGAFKGTYHVLGGTLSAMDGRGPEALRIQPLLARVSEGKAQEIILALSATVAGQTTAHYLVDVLPKSGVRISRLGQGIPVGGELDYMDEGTLLAAMHARQDY